MAFACFHRGGVAAPEVLEPGVPAIQPVLVGRLDSSFCQEFSQSAATDWGLRLGSVRVGPQKVCRTTPPPAPIKAR